MKYYIIAGEASGDLHGANLMKELKQLDPQAAFRVWGGDKMRAQGGEMVVHYSQMNFMGFFEVAANLFTILKLLRKCRRDILAYQPEVVILIDYPGFNMRIAHFAHLNNIKVFYYISPSVWAWHQSRVFQIKQWVTRMFVILPFEKEFYARFGVEVEFKGHPLPDELTNYLRLGKAEICQHLNLDNRKVIALLPGSRPQEITKIFKVMLSIIPEYPQHQFVVAGVSTLPKELYTKIIGNAPVRLFFNETYKILQIADAAVVTSGTATLETALFKVPQVVCYKANYISYLIARQLARVNYISLVNLILNKPIVKELLQAELNTRTLKAELDKILVSESIRQNMRNQYEELAKMLGGTGASARIAESMLRLLKVQPKKRE